MAINRIRIKDFLVFKDEFETDFCPGVNVIIGSNGTGKTTLLKCLYGGTDTILYPASRYFNAFGFSDRKDDVGIARLFVPNEKCDDDKDNLPPVTVYLSAPESWNKKSVMIPAAEMLSHSKGLLALYYERMMPFDQTQIDILVNAQFPETREIKPNAANILDRIKSIIGGEVVFENDSFFTQKDIGEKISFMLEASGFKRLGLLWKLLRNGLLEAGSILFWDEPENSLNPELVPVLVDILLELSRNDVQIFIATHSEILASYFSVNRQKGDIVMFTSLYKDNERINADVSDRFDLLKPNTLTAEPVKLYEKMLEKGLGGNG